MQKIVIIDYGAGNVQSVKFALERLGVAAILSNDAAIIASADKVIFPGVGEASSAMKEVKKQGLDKVIPNLKQPVLGICLGMQLMCRHSDEGNTDCLGIFPLGVKKFMHDMKIPHTGWNEIVSLKGALFKEISEKEFVYYVHSFFIEDSVFTIAKTDYGIPFAGAVQKDNFYACQFHPEKSGEVGQRILQNFLEI